MPETAETSDTAGPDHDPDDEVRVFVSAPASVPPVQVWDVLVNRTHEWWGEPYLTADAGPMRLEPRLGGRLWSGPAEAGGDGDLHGTVRLFDPPRVLEIGGVLVPGAYAGSIAFTVTKTALGSELHVEQSARGRIEAVTEERMADGWNLLTTRLAELAER